MLNKDAYERGREALSKAWEEAKAGTATPNLPNEIVSAIATAMSPDAQIAQRYSLVTQVLLKLVVGNSDARKLQNFETVEGQFSARTFAKETVVKLRPVGRRLGGSEDPYVSNPLRQDRMEDKMLKGKQGGPRWGAVFQVLGYIDANPDSCGKILRQALLEIRERPEVTEKPARPLPPAEDPVDLATLSDVGGIDQDQLLDIIDVLESDQPQVIFAGPPGTSKTYIAEALAKYVTGGNRSHYRVVQLHASYGYEEFVEGLRPTVEDGGNLHFKVVGGAVRTIADNMEASDKRVLILDEMNRANLPRVLGELLYALERRGEPIDLLHTKDFRLPQGLIFIGTMNTADRSIRSIDAAVRRRFQIFDFPPSSIVLRLFYEHVENEIDDLVAGFEALNLRLTELLDRHHTVGHTFFMDARGMTPSRLRQVWLRQIAPLLEEYLFDQPDLLEEFTVETYWPSIVGA